MEVQMNAVYRYAFDRNTEIAEIEASLLLALVSCESLHGEVQVRLDAAHLLDERKRVCVIDAATPVGRTLNKLFTGYLRREFGENSFTVERLNGPSAPDLAARRREPAM